MAALGNKILAVVLTIAGVYDTILGLMSFGQGGNVLIFGLPANLVIGPILFVVGVILVKKWVLVKDEPMKTKKS